MRDYSISIYSDHFSDFDLLTFTVSLNHLLSTFTIFAWFCSPKGWWNHCLCMKISYWSFIPCLNPEMNCALFILWTPINPGSCHAEVFLFFLAPLISALKFCICPWSPISQKPYFLPIQIKRLYGICQHAGIMYLWNLGKHLKNSKHPIFFCWVDKHFWQLSIHHLSTLGSSLCNYRHKVSYPIFSLHA